MAFSESEPMASLGWAGPWACTGTANRGESARPGLPQSSLISFPEFPVGCEETQVVVMVYSQLAGRWGCRFEFGSAALVIPPCLAPA